MPQILTGLVTRVGTKAKTCTVTTSRIFEHPKYIKMVERTKKYLVHDEFRLAREGDSVTIVHKPNISLKKQYTLYSINRAHLTMAEDKSRRFPPQIPASLRKPMSRENQDIKHLLGEAIRRRRPLRAQQHKEKVRIARQSKLSKRSARRAKLRKEAIARGELPPDPEKASATKAGAAGKRQIKPRKKGPAVPTVNSGAASKVVKAVKKAVKKVVTPKAVTPKVAAKKAGEARDTP